MKPLPGPTNLFCHASLNKNTGMFISENLPCVTNIVHTLPCSPFDSRVYNYDKLLSILSNLNISIFPSKTATKYKIWPI